MPRPIKPLSGRVLTRPTLWMSRNFNFTHSRGLSSYYQQVHHEKLLSFGYCKVNHPLSKFLGLISYSTCQDHLKLKIFGRERRHFSISSCNLNAPKSRDIEQYLKSKQVPYKNGYTSIMLPCIFCSKEEQQQSNENNNNNSNLQDNNDDSWSMFVNKTTGRFICKKCGESGAWNELKFLKSDKASPEHRNTEEPVIKASLSSDDKPEVTPNEVFERSKHLSELTQQEQNSVIKILNLKNISPETIEKFHVKFCNHQFADQVRSVRDKLCMLVPWYDIKKGHLIAVKLIPIDNDETAKIIPRHACNGLFGYHCTSNDATQVVITSSELDALAVHQATGVNAVALPNGISQLPPEVLPQLELFERIILWFDNDIRSKQAIGQFAKKLNIERCSFVRLLEDGSPNGALEALNKGLNLKSIVSKARNLKHKEILTFNQLRDDVYGEFINAEQVAGVKWKRFPGLSHILKGHRRGELSILTGQTGTGKTTLLSELSLDLCSQGVNTLWGSFEIRNVRLVKSMLCQYSGLNLEQSIGQYNYWADKFDSLPMYFMSYFGSQSIESVLQTMNDAVYVYDIDHVIIDNLQFMMASASKFADRFSAMDSAITSFRDFASSKNVHVTLVIHPRKENQDSELQTASIFGTAKASQEADNIIILQDSKGRTSRRYLQVTKNRFDGILGKVPLDFNRDSLCMSGFHRDTRTGEGKIPTNEQASKKKQNLTSFE